MTQRTTTGISPRPGRARVGLVLTALLVGVGVAVAAPSAIWNFNPTGEQHPLMGDPTNGRRLYMANCATCHGFRGAGDGPAAGILGGTPDDLTSGALMNARSDKQLFVRVAEGWKSAGKQVMPGFARDLDKGERWDVVAYLRTLHPALEAFFPGASKYLAGEYEFHTFGLERVEEALRRRVREPERRFTVFTVYRGLKRLSGPELLDGSDSRVLARLSKKAKIGYLVFGPMEWRGQTYQVSIAVTPGITITQAMAWGDSAEVKALNKLLAKFEGQGRRGKYARLRPSKTPKDLQAALSDLFIRGMEAVYEYEAEERKRTWAETGLDEELQEAPSDVDFDFTQKPKRR